MSTATTSTDHAAVTDADKVVRDATWNGSAPVDLGDGRWQYATYGGSSFVTDRAAGVSLDVAQGEHILTTLMGANLLGDIIATDL